MPTTRETGVTEARGGLSDLVNDVAYQKQRVVLKRHGKPRAALISIADLHILEVLERELDLRVLRAAFADPRNAKAIPWDDVKAKLGIVTQRDKRAKSAGPTSSGR
jgi:prevent-host-death family protein